MYPVYTPVSRPLTPWSPGARDGFPTVPLSAPRYGLPTCNDAGSGMIVRGFPITVAGPRRICTGFPFIPQWAPLAKTCIPVSEDDYGVKRNRHSVGLENTLGLWLRGALRLPGSQ